MIGNIMKFMLFYFKISIWEDEISAFSYTSTRKNIDIYFFYYNNVTMLKMKRKIFIICFLDMKYKEKFTYLL